MNPRLIDMLNYIREQGAVHQDDLARYLGVSTRTVRTYVQRANQTLAGVAEISHGRGQGYRLDVADEESLDGLLSDEAFRRTASLPETQEGRVEYLLCDLIARVDWITLDVLAETLYTSRRTISDDLKLVETQLAHFGLSLERRPHYGMRVVGSEMGRRLCMAHLAAAHEADPGLVIDSTMLAKVSNCIDRVTADEGFAVNGIAYQNLVVHIAVAVVRINEGAYAPMEFEQLRNIKSEPTYSIAAHIAADIERMFEVDLPDEEIAYIALHLSGRQLLQEEDVDQDLVISDEVWDIVSEMLEAIWKNFHFDFRGDLELRMNLARHIVPLAVRLRYHMRLRNPLLADITTRFPLAWSMANESASVLSRHYQAVPSEDEIGYIALAFALALERQQEGGPKKNILLVCASGAGSARLLEHQYRQEFGAHLDQVVTCDVSHIDAIDLSHIDYVFTTVPLPHEMPVPVRRVQFFLDPTEIGDVRRVLVQGEGANNVGAESFFDERLFCPHLACTSREDVISALCTALRKVTDAPDSVEQLVWQREELAPSAFGGLIAMPHPIEPVTEHTHVAVGLLDEAIDWAGVPVQIVFLVSISTMKGRDLDGLYKALVRFMNDGRLGAKLLEVQSFSTLCSLLREDR